MEFKHPKYYKNLRKLYRLCNRDQAISKPEPTGHARVRPGPGLKQQATSFKHQAQIKNYNRRQAPSNKHQASSRKLQAPRFLNHGTFEND